MKEEGHKDWLKGKGNRKVRKERKKEGIKKRGKDKMRETKEQKL